MASTEHAAVIGYEAAEVLDVDAKTEGGLPKPAEGCKLFSVLFLVPCLGDVITKMQTTFPVHKAFLVLGANEVPITVQPVTHNGAQAGSIVWRDAPLFRNLVRVAVRVVCDGPEAAQTLSRAATRLYIVYDVWAPPFAQAFAAYAGELIVGAPSVAATLVHRRAGNEFLHTQVGPQSGAVRWWEAAVLWAAKQQAAAEEEQKAAENAAAADEKDAKDETSAASAESAESPESPEEGPPSAAIPEDAETSAASAEESAENAGPDVKRFLSKFHRQERPARHPRRARAKPAPAADAPPE